MAASCISLPAGHAAPFEAQAADAFAALDDLAQATPNGYLLVHAPEDLLGTIARHLARRADARRVICVDGAAVEPWRELARRLAVEGDDPLAVAAAMLRRAHEAVVLVCAPSPSRWGCAVADELARRLAGEARGAAWLVELTCERRSPYAEPHGVPEIATAEDVERWWQAMWRAERRPLARDRRGERLDRLERWWWSASAHAAAQGPAGVVERLGETATRAFARLALLGRSCPREALRRLGIEPAATDELERAGLVGRDESGRTWLRPAPPVEPRRDDALVVLEHLEQSGDPWDALRAAELFLRVGRVEPALGAAERALTGAEATAREDLWHRLERGLDECTLSVAQLLSLSALGLRLGDVDAALRVARRAAAQEESAAPGRPGFAALLALGRATAARGDLSTAQSLLERAMDQAPGQEPRLEAAVELADACCSGGDVDQARRLAADAVRSASAPATRLSARNVVGKLLMAEGTWHDAEQSFAEDAHDAAAAGEVEAELRAQLNRATALVGGGRRTEARALLEALMDRAERAGVLRAKAFALSNLAVLACHRHDYAAALTLREQAIVAFRRIGNRKWLARSMIYLADLRLDLGLVDEADQALAFARQVLGQVVPPTQAAWMSIVQSRVHFERGQLGRAAAEIEAAIGSAARSTDGAMLSSCHCLAARIALGEDDLARAAAEIVRARTAANGAETETEIALVEARIELRAGRAAGEAAARALSLALLNKDRGRMAEAHAILHHAAVRAGDETLARKELGSVRRLHDAIVASLPAELRARCSERLARATRGGPPAATAAAADAEPVSRRGGKIGMVGSHPAMLALYASLEKVAATDATVLVAGESGTGKELVADAIHRESVRRRGPIVKVNCAALVETLLLSELFGHEKGAFTGATNQRRGCFEHADGGTIFLDEIGDISAATQAALLRVLQDRTFHRVGGTEAVRVDVRVICATHRDLAAMVQRGTFREDLYYRLSCMVLEVPSLRERLADLPLLAAEILLRISRENEVPLRRLAPDALSLLAEHRWSGNVRELENVLRASALFSDGDVISANDLRRHAVTLRSARVTAPVENTASVTAPVTMAAAPRAETPAPLAEALTPRVDPCDVAEDAVYAAVRGGTGLREIQKRLEQECIIRALRETDGHVTRAAALLGIKRPRLSQLIKEHNLRTGEEQES